MDFSMRLCAVISLLLLVSMATDMGSPFVDAQITQTCDIRICNRLCQRRQLYGCCVILPGFQTRCRCLREPCIFYREVEIPETKDMAMKEQVA